VLTALSRTFRLANDPGSLGLSCDETGLSLAGVPLLRTTVSGFEPRASIEIEVLMRRAYPGVGDLSSLSSGLWAVAKAFNEGDLAKAMVAATLLRLVDLDWAGAARIAQADDALKYDPDEPRDWRGQWTDGDGDGEPDEVNPDTLTDVIYRGFYHDKVVNKLARIARARGYRVVTETRLISVAGGATRADLIVMPPAGLPIVIEVKTGLNPRYTAGQWAVFPMASLGEHVFSPDAKISQLGFLPGVVLPPMQVYEFYKKDKVTPMRTRGLYL